MNKIIDHYRNDCLTGVVATSELADFPASRLLDNHPKRLYKSDGANQARLTFSVAAGAQGLAIFNTNAERGVANISDPNEITWGNVDWGNVVWITASVPTSTYLITSAYSRTLWVEFAAMDTNVHIDVTLTNMDEPVYAGCAKAGPIVATGHDPLKASFAEYTEDTSIEYKLSSGAYWSLDLETLRGYQGQLSVPIATAKELLSLARDARKKPLAMMVTSEGADWALFAKFVNQPTAAYNQIDDAVVDFNVIEVL